MNITVKRAITGLFIIAFILLPILAVPAYFYVFIFVFTLITFFSLLEFFNLLIKHQEVYPLKWLASITGTLLFVISSLVVFLRISIIYYGIVVFMIILITAAELYRKREKPFDNIAYTLLGILWIAMPFSCFNFLFIDRLYNGNTHILAMALFVFLWVNDTGAYIIGISFGKRKLFERISPKKSWEGTIGGLFFTLLTAFIVSFFWTGFSLIDWCIFGLIAAVSGIFGDLTESLFKRSINCKDSGNILPGHGGFLDRFDCVFFAAPMVLFYVVIKYHFGL